MNELNKKTIRQLNETMINDVEDNKIRAEKFHRAAHTLQRTMDRAGQHQNDQDEIKEDFDRVPELFKELRKHDQANNSIRDHYEDLNEETREKIRWLTKNKPLEQRIKLKPVEIPAFFGNIKAWLSFSTWRLRYPVKIYTTKRTGKRRSDTINKALTHQHKKL